jgi:hypothetical protein
MHLGLGAAALCGVGEPSTSGSIPVRPVLSLSPQAIKLPELPVQHTEDVVSQAERFDSQECRVALSKETDWEHLCGGKRALHNPLCLRMQQKFLRMRTSSQDHRYREALYVRNQKAASQLWVREFAKMLGIEGKFPGLRHTTNLRTSNQTFVFSFVREPLQTALDGARCPPTDSSLIPPET